MKQFLFFVLTYLIIINNVLPQGAAINQSGNVADPSAILDVSSGSQGVLTPRMTASQKNAISNPANGLLIYQTDSIAGFYYYDLNHWELIKSEVASVMNFSLASNKTRTGGTPAGASWLPLNISVSWISGSYSPVQLSIQGLPSGVYYSLSQSTGVPPFTSKLTFTIDAGVSPGTYPFTVKGEGGNTVKTITDTLIVVNGKIAFVTNNIYIGNLGGLPGADNRCTQSAAAAGLPGIYKAWLSSPEENAISRVADVYYYRTDVKLICTGKTDLTDGSLGYPINITEYADPITTDLLVWTGTKMDGTLYTYITAHCNSWLTSSSGTQGSRGYANHSTSGWWTDWNYGQCNSTNYRLYCFQQ